MADRSKLSKGSRVLSQREGGGGYARTSSALGGSKGRGTRAHPSRLTAARLRRALAHLFSPRVPYGTTYTRARARSSRPFFALTRFTPIRNRALQQLGPRSRGAREEPRPIRAYLSRAAHACSPTYNSIRNIKVEPTSIQRFVKPTSAIFDFAYSIRIAPRSEERRKDPWRVAIAWAA